MVFVWGNKGYQDHLGYIISECSKCKTKGIFSVEQVRKKFTVYFVPTFGYSQKQYITCTNCQATFEVPKELKPEIAKNLISQDELSALIQEANKETSTVEKPQEKTVVESSSVGNAKDTKSSMHYCQSCGNRVTDGATYCPNCGTKLENTPIINQREAPMKDSALKYECLCCGASYNANWWEIYGAKYRCCKNLPRAEQEELWNNRLNPEIPLNNCPHRL